MKLGVMNDAKCDLYYAVGDKGITCSFSSRLFSKIHTQVFCIRLSLFLSSWLGPCVCLRMWLCACVFVHLGVCVPKGVVEHEGLSCRPILLSSSSFLSISQCLE